MTLAGIQDLEQLGGFAVTGVLEAGKSQGQAIEQIVADRQGRAAAAQLALRGKGRALIFRLRKISASPFPPSPFTPLHPLKPPESPYVTGSTLGGPGLL